MRQNFCGISDSFPCSKVSYDTVRRYLYLMYIWLLIFFLNVYSTIMYNVSLLLRARYFWGACYFQDLLAATKFWRYFRWVATFGGVVTFRTLRYHCGTLSCVFCGASGLERATPMIMCVCFFGGVQLGFRGVKRVRLIYQLCFLQIAFLNFKLAWLRMFLKCQKNARETRTWDWTRLTVN